MEKTFIEALIKVSCEKSATLFIYVILYKYISNIIYIHIVKKKLHNGLLALLIRIIFQRRVVAGSPWFEY